MNSIIDNEARRLKDFEQPRENFTQRNISIPRDLLHSPKKSTVVLWIKSEDRFWNPENKVEYP